jgi:anti-sigma B factor antagonist/stage II sporulation protein AA (anti-sigma F factor antagonist)
MAGSGFGLKCERGERALLAFASGRVDHTNAEAFRLALWPALDDCRSAGDAVILDLAGLSYISSAGLRVLMLAAREAGAKGGTLVVAGLQPVVREIFEITRFDRVFRVFADAAQAATTLAGERPATAS